jgi:hypothetical protein
MGTMPPEVGAGRTGTVRLRRRVRRWQAATLLLTSLVVLLGSLVVLGSTSVGAPASSGAGQAGTAVDGDTAETGRHRRRPASAEWHEQVALGWAAVADRPEVAADHFRRAIVADHDRAEAWRGLGIARLGLADADVARVALCTARGLSRRRSAELERVLQDERIVCPPAPARRPGKRRPSGGRPRAR